MKTILVCGAFLAAIISECGAQSSVSPTVNFTLRDSNLDGSADVVDSTPDNSGFDGSLTVHSIYQEDRVFAEFNMANRPSGWAGTVLQFKNKNIGGFPPSTLQISYYTGNGAVDLSDWNIPFHVITDVPISTAIPQTYNIDVSSVAATFSGSGFVGFRFELIDSALNQKLLNAASIMLVDVPEPTIPVVALVGALCCLARRSTARAC